MVRVVSAFTLLIALIAAFNRGTGSGAPTVPTAAGMTAPITTDAVGSLGCSATACHGSTDAAALSHERTKNGWATSATIFHALDPHRNAFAALESPLGRDIIAKLRQSDDSFHASATREVRCLACHVNPSLAMGQSDLQRDGVSCEACHGNAKGWEAVHTLNGFDRHVAGFNDLKIAGNAATICAGCHVGAPAENGLPRRDMNHDMIAAGHPELKHPPLVRPLPPFVKGAAVADSTAQWEQSYEALLARLPKHWKVSKEIDTAAFHAAAIRLQAARPASEFEQMECRACHKTLPAK